MNELELTIDGRSARVPQGSTILDAARTLGIEIPTLCHVPGLEPSSSCFLCAVQIDGRRTLSPACSMPVSEGMVVTTTSEDVEAGRKMGLELLLSDHAGDCLAPCRAACPAGLDIPGFVYEIATGRPRRTMEVISETLVLPGALGRICPRLCEQHCRRTPYDASLSIARLHRFAADRDLATGDPYLPPRKASSGLEVAIIGAGPAGLAAAYWLLQAGHGVTLFDAKPLPGGMLRYGIPEYRLPKGDLDREVDLLRRMGARFAMERRWGEDFTLADLRERHDAVFIGIGAQGARGLGCPGEELALSGIELLDRVARGERPALGDRVIVVGGGNTAMDASRSARRLGPGEVRVLYRRSRDEMPCLLEEVDGAEEEGVVVDYLVAPVELERRSGVLRLTCVRMQLGEPDRSGRRAPVPIEGSEHTLEATTVIAAIGQTVDTSIASREGLVVSRWGVAADAGTLATNLEGVFAGGDAVTGADLAVRAVAAGHVAAASIDQYLRGEPVTGLRKPMNIALRGLEEHELAAIFRRVEKTARAAEGHLDPARRVRGFDEIEPALSVEEAARESRRCLSCGCRKADGCRLRALGTRYGVDPYRFRGERRQFTQDVSHPEVIYEPGKCILCNSCVEIAARHREELGLSAIGRGFQVTVGVPLHRSLADGLKRAARECAEACPTGAIALRTARACDLCDACLLSAQCGSPEAVVPALGHSNGPARRDLGRSADALGPA